MFKDTMDLVETRQELDGYKLIEVEEYQDSVTGETRQESKVLRDVTEGIKAFASLQSLADEYKENEKEIEKLKERIRMIKEDVEKLCPPDFKMEEKFTFGDYKYKVVVEVTPWGKGVRVLKEKSIRYSREIISGDEQRWAEIDKETKDYEPTNSWEVPTDLQRVVEDYVPLVEAEYNRIKKAYKIYEDAHNSLVDLTHDDNMKLDALSSAQERIITTVKTVINEDEDLRSAIVHKIDSTNWQKIIEYASNVMKGGVSNEGL